MADVIRILVADDDALVRAGLSLMLGGRSEFDVVGEAADGEQAVAATRRLAPDVVLMDIRMPRMDGLAAIEELRATGSPAAIVVLTTFDTDDHVLRALRLGASGFLLKDTPPTEILQAVRRVAAGESILSPKAVERLIDHVRGGVDADDDHRAGRCRAALAGLTDREREVALAVGRGGSNAEIAAELYMSVATVKTYVSRLMAKLGCANRVQVAILVHEARRAG